MGLLDNLWGDARNAASGRDALATALFSALGRAGPSTVQADALPDLIHRFEQAGLGDVVHSWVDNAQTNKPVTPKQVRSALGEDTIQDVASHTGLDGHTLLQELAAALPQLIDSMTPNGRVPSGPAEAAASTSASSKAAQKPGDAESAPQAEPNPQVAQAVQRTDPTEPVQQPQPYSDRAR